MNLTTIRRATVRVAAGFFLSAAAVTPALAQQVHLVESNATVIRGGAYANTNFSQDTVLATRASSDDTYVRRIILKFDTENNITAGAPIQSAILTVTIAGGNSESRQIAAYRVANSYEEVETTWNRRKASTYWSAAGGDLAQKTDTRTVTNAVGTVVSFNVTALVQGAINGDYGSSRYSRIALVDGGASSKDSYKEYYSDEAGDPSVRPLLTVTYGATTTPPTVTPPPTTATQLRVLQWNTHHGGYGTDGRYDPDRLATWIVKMKPDIIMLNEIEKNTYWGSEDQPSRYKALVESKTGRTWYWMFAQEWGDWYANGKGHLVLSKYPIASIDRVAISYDRVIGDAAIVVNGRTLSLVVTHLDPDSSTRRLVQAQEVTAWALAHPENRILTGDMNAWPDQSSIAEFNKSYNDSWTVATSKGTAYQYSDLAPDGATKKGRIDYIFSSKNASNLVVLSSQVYDTRDSSGYMPSDHRPVVTTFEVR
jgi:endonuclease/exonuclease/phosphatase family metal-dependent hydrolase